MSDEYCPECGEPDHGEETCPVLSDLLNRMLDAMSKQGGSGAIWHSEDGELIVVNHPEPKGRPS